MRHSHADALMARKCTNSMRVLGGERSILGRGLMRAFFGSANSDDASGLFGAGVR